MFDNSGEMTPPCGVPLSILLPPTFHHSRSEPLLKQLEHSPTRDASFPQSHQLLVVDAPEVVPNVGIQHMVSILGSEFSQPLQRLRRPSLRAEAVRARSKVRLEYRLPHQ